MNAANRRAAFTLRDRVLCLSPVLTTSAGETIMTISEESRHHLYEHLRQLLGREDATVLMEHLPPLGWADVATKRDLDALEQRADGRFDRIDDRFRLIDDRLGRIDDRFRLIDDRLEQIDGRFDRIDDRFGRIEARLERIDDRFDQLRSEFRSSLLAVMSMMVVLVASMVAAVKL